MRVCDCCRGDVRNAEVYSGQQIGPWFHGTLYMCSECAKQYETVVDFVHRMLEGKVGARMREGVAGLCELEELAAQRGVTSL